MTHTQRFHCFNPIKNNDKVYILTMKECQSNTIRELNTFDVIAQYGRRGQQLTPFIVKANASQQEAVSAFEKVVRTRLAHNYQPVERIPA